jgi:hypothetical protein
MIYKLESYTKTLYFNDSVSLNEYLDSNGYVRADEYDCIYKAPNKPMVKLRVKENSHSKIPFRKVTDQEVELLIKNMYGKDYKIHKDKGYVELFLFNERCSLPLVYLVAKAQRSLESNILKEYIESGKCDLEDLEIKGTFVRLKNTNVTCILNKAI